MNYSSLLLFDMVYHPSFDAHTQFEDSCSWREMSKAKKEQAKAKRQDALVAMAASTLHASS